ncbi:MAG: response regulator transcription factor [Terriglobia bacterium]
MADVNTAPVKILIAEDEPLSRRVLYQNLRTWGYDVLVAANGSEAWDILMREPDVHVAILDWMMPGRDGIEVLRLVREHLAGRFIYLIMLTARAGKDDVVEGLTAQADDYITKPFNQAELKARLQVGLRVAGLQRALAERVRELQEALAKVKTLQGLLPICSYCKRIRNDQNYWQQVEIYIAAHSHAEFTHGICPTCYAEHVQTELDELARA